MPANPLAAHPPWRQLLVLVVALPVVVTAAIMAFAWPSGRLQPRDLPVGIVGATPATQQVVAGLAKARPDGFDFHLYASAASARAAIHHRDVYGAIVMDPRGITVLEASAASNTVAQLLTGVGDQVATSETRQAAAAGGTSAALRATIVDVVPSSKDDPRGAVMSSALLPLTICSIIIASAVAVLVAVKPAWRQLVALTSVAAVAGAGVYLIAQTWLGALPHQPWQSWGSITLTMLAISSATAGLCALIGTAGLALSAGLMVFVGNPFSGATSAPELLPDAVHHLGQWLPPGAGANLLRSSAYFDGNGAAGPLTVILLWIAFGLGAVVVGHHTSPRFAAHPERGDR